jgi:hypothetical protein
MVESVGIVAERSGLVAALCQKGYLWYRRFEAAIAAKATAPPADHVIVGLDLSKLEEHLSSFNGMDSH